MTSWAFCWHISLVDARGLCLLLVLGGRVVVVGWQGGGGG